MAMVNLLVALKGNFPWLWKEGLGLYALGEKDGRWQLLLPVRQQVN